MNNQCTYTVQSALTKLIIMLIKSYKPHLTLIIVPLTAVTFLWLIVRYILLTQCPCKSKITQLYNTRFGYQNILRFYISVDNLKLTQVVIFIYNSFKKQLLLFYTEWKISISVEVTNGRQSFLRAIKHIHGGSTVFLL